MMNHGTIAVPNTTEKAENLQLPQATDANAGHPYKADIYIWILSAL